MKCKLYRLDIESPETSKRVKTLIATFESECDAIRTASLYTTTRDIESYQIDLGRGKMSQVFYSSRVIRCPICDSDYRVNECRERVNAGYDTVRCGGCETLFEIPSFDQFDGQKARAIDIPASARGIK